MSKWKPDDIIRAPACSGGFRVWRVIAVCLGGEHQESVVEIETLDRLTNTQGRMCVPIELIDAALGIIKKEAMNNDLVRLAMDRACDRYGGSDRTFNVSNFSHALVDMSPTDEQIDGHIVRLILTGRPDVEVLGGGYYRVLQEEVSNE